MRRIEVQYGFASPELFGTIAAYIQIDVAGEGVVRDLLPPDVSAISVPVSGRWAHAAIGEPDSQDETLPTLFGNTSKAHWADGESGTAFLAVLFPLAWPKLLQMPADRFSNRVEPLAMVLGARADALDRAVKAADGFEARKQAANAFFESLRAAAPPVPAAATIRAIGEALADPACASVEEMAQRAGVSQAKLARVARAAYGFPPKLLIRRARFRRMLHRMDAHTYADWRDYIDDQYVDQSHLIRDFRFFMGMSPRRYMALERPVVAAALETFRRMMAQDFGNMWQG